MSYTNNTGLPSPTTILSPFINADYFTEESRIRGTRVHAACANHLLGKFVIIEKKYRGYLDSFKRWCDEEQPEALIVEKRLISTNYGYCGMPDFFGRIKNRPACGVADLKTSVALGKAWPLQVAAYERLCFETEPDMVQETIWSCSLRLKSDGSYPLVEYYNDFELRFNIFLGALNLYRHFGPK